jgi:hypothetical protein
MFGFLRALEVSPTGGSFTSTSSYQPSDLSVEAYNLGSASVLSLGRPQLRQVIHYSLTFKSLSRTNVRRVLPYADKSELSV